MFFNRYYDPKLTRRGFADFLIERTESSRNERGDKILEILDSSLNKDGLIILYKNTEKQVEYTRTHEPDCIVSLDDKYLLYFMLSKEDGYWTYKSMPCSAGVFIENCPKRIIDNLKTDNPRFDRACKSEAEGVNEDRHFLSTIRHWEEAAEKRKAQREKIKNLKKIMSDAMAEESLYVEFVDSLLFRDSPLPPLSRYKVTSLTTKRANHLVIKIDGSRVDAPYDSIKAVYKGERGKLIWEKA